MDIDPKDLQSPEASAYWRDIRNLPPDTPIFDEQAVKAKFFPKPKSHILAESAYGGSDIRECMCGKVVLHYADGRTVNWSDGEAHECYPEIPEPPPQTNMPAPRIPATNKNSDWVV